MATYSNNPFAFNNVDSKASSNTPPISENTSVFARVVSIVLNKDNDDYKIKGETLVLNGIRFRQLGSTATGPEEDADTSTYPFAYPLDSNIKRIPVVGEIVEIVGKAKNLNDSTVGVENFYTFPVNVFNRTRENIFPDETDPDYAKKVEERFTNVHSYPPLESFEGDIIIEGRSGQSIRMSGLGKERGNFVDSTSYSAPITIVRNGQPKKPSTLPTFEDINQDDSSIYLTSNHVIPLVQASKSVKSYNTPPVDTNTYRGKQAIINADRVVINSKKENTLISSTLSTGLTGKEVHLDGEKEISLDASKILLGELARRQEQPGVRGAALEDYNKEVQKLLKNIAVTLKAVPPAPIAISAALTNVSATIEATIEILNGKLPAIKSKKVFIE